MNRWWPLVQFHGSRRTKDEVVPYGHSDGTNILSFFVQSNRIKQGTNTKTQSAHSSQSLVWAGPPGPQEQQLGWPLLTWSFGWFGERTGFQWFSIFHDFPCYLIIIFCSNALIFQKLHEDFQSERCLSPNQFQQRCFFSTKSFKNYSLLQRLLKHCKVMQSWIILWGALCGRASCAPNSEAGIARGPLWRVEYICVASLTFEGWHSIWRVFSTAIRIWTSKTLPYYTSTHIWYHMILMQRERSEVLSGNLA